jgi:hypothetical protein
LAVQEGKCLNYARLGDGTDGVAQTKTPGRQQGKKRRRSLCLRLVGRLIGVLDAACRYEAPRSRASVDGFLP